ncbi:MAG: M14 family zinc carboxypeptidase, partial [Candidatus Marinimicrobia bacterium]|nr:M14 family zinc carboxypeptidase [Candidatus Neomarinimicrobiota bacterium]
MMKYFKHFIFIGLVLPLFSQENALPGFYHTYEEIESQLNAWDEEFGNTPTGYGIIFHKEIIGYSTEENLPFWAVKISDNADVDEDEARILILGQCHAEEIYGVEISMALINCFLNTGIQECFSTTLATQVLQNLQNLEIWVVPTHNPEGLRVVHGYEETVDDSTQWIQDVSYRKNKRDVNNNGIFSFDNTVEAGSDSDGVDLNRNYDFNWIFGDDKFVEDCSGSYCSHFDYYRGEAPFSELENQAIRDFAIEKQFLVSIAYHSSRSGNVSEKVIYSWEWDETKFSPDFDVINDIGIQLSNQIFKDAMDGSTYTPTTSKSRKGNAHDWFYTETGCIQYLIEVGTANMQSTDSTHVYQIIEDNMNGAFYLLARARGNSNFVDKYQVTGIVNAGNTGELVHAEVKILEMDGGVLKPRFTDSFGRFRRLLNEGNYTLKVSAQGFEDYEQSFYSSSSQVTEMNVVLDPLPTHNFTLELTVPDGIPSSLQLFRKTKLKTDTLNISENGNIFEWYEDYYTIT